MTAKIKSLSTTKKVLLGIGGFFVLMMIIGAIAPPPEKESSKELIQTSSNVKSESTTKEKKPKIETKVVEESQPIPYQSTTVSDSTLATGKTVIAVDGINGTKIIVYQVTYSDGIETSRKQVSEQVIKQPVNEVKRLGTKVAVAPPTSAPVPSGNCDPNYSGCVPVASDVDCAGGSGNGPAYVSGPVSVVGVDVYDLDRDNDGFACE